jgi:type III secretion protein R
VRWIDRGHLARCTPEAPRGLGCTVFTEPGRGACLTRPLVGVRVPALPRPNRAERRAHRALERAHRRPARAAPRPARRAFAEPPTPAPRRVAAGPEAAPHRDPRAPRGGRWVGLLSAALLTVALGSVAFSSEAEAQQRRTRLKPQDLTLKGSVAARPLVLLGALGALTLLPFVIIMVTSFVKISVVLSIIRSAIGTQQIPPTQVITGLAIILTVYIMAPVGLEIYKATEDLIQERRPGSSLVSAETVDLVFDAAVQAEGPMKAFLAKNSHVKDRAMFFSMAKRLRKPEDRSGVGPDDFMVLVPSFVISELKESFQIGFIIFVPFLVIDLIVSNILMALGMQMLSPTTISLPFKLLLFVMIDGWYLITKGLITGYI